jgi:hypothetical protein
MTVWDSGQYYKTTNYAPRVVIYATIWSVIYNSKFMILNLL